MGLDMYLDKYPKIGLSVEVMNGVESMWRWKEKGKDKEYSLEDWCGFKENDLPPKDMIDLCEKFRHVNYAAWDVEKRWPNNDMHDQVGYWRKANAIHNWFENHLLKDWQKEFEEFENCKYYNVTKEILESLRNDCKYVLDNTKLVPGKVKNGSRYLGSVRWEDILEDGLVVDDSSICEEVLPTRDGFFFGGLQYNEWYIEDIKYTFDLCEKLLKETDFDHYELFYHVSW